MEQQERKELTREERLAIEEQAIEALLELGVKFSVPLKIKPYNEPKLHRWARTRLPFLKLSVRDRRVPADWNVGTLEVPNVDTMQMETVYQRNFHVKPLYLGTIDYLRKLYIEIEFDEGKIQERPKEESGRLFKYIDTMAKIVAVAVVNRPEATDPLGSKEVRELVPFFRNHLTVPRLQKLCGVIRTMMDDAGFTNSIRLLSGLGLTKPKSEPGADLVE